MKRWFDTFIFSNIYIALASVSMCCGTLSYFGQSFDPFLIVFIFFSTLSSYSLHWSLTDSTKDSVRILWTRQHRKLLRNVFIFSALVVCVTFFYISHLWKIILPLSLLTFLYTAPKIEHPAFFSLKGRAFAKTFYLASVWLVVTVFLPLWNANLLFSKEIYCFAANRFLFLFSICAIFDFRDRNEDFGIKNLITYFDAQELLLFLVFTFLFFIALAIPAITYFSFITYFRLVLPMVLLLATLKISKNTDNDYWFYLFLDGLLILSGLLLIYS